MRYAELEASLFRGEHAYAAVAPLVGLSLGTAVDLGNGIRVRAAASGELASYWPEAGGLLPQHFGREPDRVCVLELERALPPGSGEAPDAPGELADAVTALRLATAGAIAAGPVLFERLDWRPYGIRPVLPIAATIPAGEATRLDQFRGRLARDLLERLPAADDDPDLGEALDRWELSVFQEGAAGAEQLRGSAHRPARGLRRRSSPPRCAPRPCSASRVVSARSCTPRSRETNRRPSSSAARSSRR